MLWTLFWHVNTATNAVGNFQIGTTMTGETVWQVFLATTISHKNLELLGHDLYFMRDKPGKEGAIAVTALGEHFSLKPQHMYIALNTDPGRSTLETLAQDFEAKKPWAIASKSTQAYAEKIAKNIDFIKAKLAGLTPPAPPSAGIAPKTVPRSSAPSTTCPAGPKGPAGPDLRNTGLFMLIAGGVAYFVVGFLRYAKIPTLRKPKMA
jgi:hypothetical protein